MCGAPDSVRTLGTRDSLPGQVIQEFRDRLDGRTKLMVCQAISIAITVVLPVPGGPYSEPLTKPISFEAVTNCEDGRAAPVNGWCDGKSWSGRLLDDIGFSSVTEFVKRLLYQVRVAMSFVISIERVIFAPGGRNSCSRSRSKFPSVVEA